MSTLKEDFENAAADSKNLGSRPSNDTLLQLYALYKQATVGDVEGKRPGFTDLKGRAKFDAWEQAAGTSSEQAMTAYVELVDGLKKKL